MDAKDIKRLLDAVKEAEISELVLETGDYKLTVKRGTEQSVVYASPVQHAPQPAPQPVSPPAQETQAAPAAPGAAPQAPAARSNLVDVTAPIVGTFYAAPSPDAPVFVKVGDRVEPGKVLCIIEAMKLMNEIEAEVSGTIAEILVRNEDPVEYGQILFRIEPG
jgi:acetyl-CoA carboxylase biotin carboxyl carrier protein